MAMQLVVCGSTLSYNTANLAGAVLSSVDQSTAVFINSTLTGNQAMVGGSVSMYNAASLLLQNSTVSHSNASRVGGIACQDASSVTLRGSEVAYSNATSAAGLMATDNCRVLVADSLVHNNVAQNAAGIYFGVNSTLNFTGCSAVVDNAALEDGGGVYIESVNFDPAILQAVVQNNTGKYSSDVYSAPQNMTVIGNSSFRNFVSRLGADAESMLQVHLLVSGYQSLPVKGQLVQCILMHESFQEPAFLGVNRTISSGDAILSLRVRQPPGQYVLSCGLPGQDVVPDVNMTLVVRSCIRGEVRPSPDSCQECQVGYFSFNPADAVCQVCPAGLAYCPGGSLIVPLPGAWRSTANSTQVHRYESSSAGLVRAAA